MKVVRTVFNGGDEETGLCRPRLVATQLGRLHASPRPRHALPRQTPHAENRAQAPDTADAHQTFGPQDHLLFENDPDARHRHWLICQSLCLWTGSVNMAISTFETLPDTAIGGTAFRFQILSQHLKREMRALTVRLTHILPSYCLERI